jgi:4-nitrophenyl phosphatase
LATHPDINCPVENGYIPDAGFFCAMIMRLTGWKKEEIAFIGDRLYTDIAVGVNNGSKGLLVLTDEAELHPVLQSDIKPDAIFENLKEISSCLC